MIKFNDDIRSYYKKGIEYSKDTVLTDEDDDLDMLNVMSFFLTDEDEYRCNMFLDDMKEKYYKQSPLSDKEILFEINSIMKTKQLHLINTQLREIKNELRMKNILDIQEKKEKGWYFD